MAEQPTYSEVVAECANIEQYISDEAGLSDYINRAYLDVKRYLLNKRGIEWVTVYSTDYLSENNEDQLLKAIRLMTISLVYKDNAQESNDSQWWDLYQSYRAEAEEHLAVARLDVDIDEDGEIEDGEELTSGQVFFRQ